MTEVAVSPAAAAATTATATEAKIEESAKKEEPAKWTPPPEVVRSEEEKKALRVLIKSGKFEKNMPKRNVWEIDVENDIVFSGSKDSIKILLVRWLSNGAGNPCIPMLGDLNYLSPQGLFLFSSMVGLGEASKLKPGEKADPAYSLTQIPEYEASMGISREEYEWRWKRTGNFHKRLKERYCEARSKNPGWCVASYEFEFEKIKNKLTQAELEDESGARVAELMYEQFMSSCSSHYKEQDKHAMKRGKGVVPSVKFSKKPFAAPPKTDATNGKPQKKFAELYPQIAAILQKRDKSDPLYPLAQQVYERYINKDKPEHLRIIPVKRPGWIKGPDGKPKRGFVQLGELDRKVTNRDSGSVEAYGDAFQYGTKFGILNIIGSVNIYVPRAHVEGQDEEANDEGFQFGEMPEDTPDTAPAPLPPPPTNSNHPPADPPTSPNPAPAPAPTPAVQPATAKTAAEGGEAQGAPQHKKTKFSPNDNWEAGGEQPEDDEITAEQVEQLIQDSEIQY